MTSSCGETHALPRGASPALIAAFGMPGVMSAWGFAALHAMARQAFGTYAAIETDTGDGLLRALAEGPGAPALVTSQYPQPSLVALLAQRRAPITLFLEDTQDAAAYLACTTGATEIGVLRAVSASCACLAGLRGLAGTTILHRSAIGRAPAERLVREISHLAGLPHESSDPGPRSGLAPDTALSFEELAAQTVEGYVPAAGAAASEAGTLAASVLAPLDGFFRDGRMRPLVWPRESFLLGDRPDEPVRGPIDLTGGARCVVYGPYLHLPAGAWTARILLGFDHRVYEQSFVMEMHGGSLLARARVGAPGAAGIFAAAMTFVVSEPHVPLELRILTERGAIEGAITSLSVELAAGAAGGAG